MKLERFDLSPGGHGPSVYCTRIDFPISRSDELVFARLCSPYRLEKARQLQTEKDKQVCLATGALLSKSVKDYMGFPKEVPLKESCDSQGKPIFEEYPRLQVSISHSGPWVFCGFHKNWFGIDVEYFNETTAQEVRKQILHPDENTLPVLEYWTIKEAVLKARGEGFLRPPNTMRINVRSGSVEVQLGDALHSTQLWNHYSRTFEDGYHLSICWLDGDES